MPIDELVERGALPLEATQAFTERFRSKFDTTGETCGTHSSTLTWLPRQPPQAVVFCNSKYDVIDAVQICRRYSIPVIPFGAGTSLEGQVNAPCGGICLDLSQMKRVIATSTDDRYTVVEPGITHEELNRAIEESGSFFPVDPGAAATIGGMVSTRASGTNAVRYGTMRENTLGLEVVLASGEAIRTGCKAKKSASGYDLTRLFVGAEGTLGVITEVTARIWPIPQAVAGGRCTFDSIELAVDSVVEALKNGSDFSRIELLDALAVKACNGYSGLGIDEAPTLFFEFHGDSEYVDREARKFVEIIRSRRGRAYAWSRDVSERSKLWAARHDAWWAIHKLFPGRQGVTTDVCVPISQLPACINAAQADVRRLGLDAPILGHVGDGNFHVLVMLDGGDRTQVAKTKELISRLNRTAIASGGTCSGEHGVGQGKVTDAAIEHGRGVTAMRAIKHALDPANIMNPGKLLA